MSTATDSWPFIEVRTAAPPLYEVEERKISKNSQCLQQFFIGKLRYRGFRKSPQKQISLKNVRSHKMRVNKSRYF